MARRVIYHNGKIPLIDNEILKLTLLTESSATASIGLPSPPFKIANDGVNTMYAYYNIGTPTNVGSIIKFDRFLNNIGSFTISISGLGDVSDFLYANSGLYYKTSSHLIYSSITGSNLTTIVASSTASTSLGSHIKYINNYLWLGDRSNGSSYTVKKISASGSSSSVIETWTFTGGDIFWPHDFCNIGDYVYSIGYCPSGAGGERILRISLTNSTTTFYSQPNPNNYGTPPTYGNAMATNGQSIYYTTKSKIYEFSSTQSFRQVFTMSPADYWWQNMSFISGKFYWNSASFITASYTASLDYSSDFVSSSNLTQSNDFYPYSDFTKLPDYNLMYFYDCKLNSNGYYITIESKNIPV